MTNSATDPAVPRPTPDAHEQPPPVAPTSSPAKPDGRPAQDPPPSFCPLADVPPGIYDD